jgi:hypothetical protein
VPPLSRPGQPLTLLISREPAPALLTTAASKTIWRDGDEAVVAYGGTLEDGRWMTVLGVGSFVFAGLDTAVVGYPDSGAPDELVEDAYRRTVLPLALQALGREVLHASAVLGPDGVIALCAVSGTGKSTIAYALSQRGYHLWSDDAVQFSIEGAGVEAIPLPFTLRLKHDSAEFFGSVEPMSVAQSSPDRLDAIYVLERAPAETVRQLDPVDAFPAVLTHAYCFDLGDTERKRRMMDMYLRLAVQVPTFHVGVPKGLDHVETVVDSIVEARE